MFTFGEKKHTHKVTLPNSVWESFGCHNKVKEKPTDDICGRERI